MPGDANHRADHERTLQIVPANDADGAAEDSLEAILAEQRQDWMTGRRIPVADRLRQHAAVAANPVQGADLVYHEFALRQELGESPDWQDYLCQFPQYATGLRLLAQADRMVERIAELLDALIMHGVPRDQFQAVCQGDGGNHRIGPADGLADAVEVASNAASEFRGGRIEGKYLFGSNRGKEALQAAGALFLLEAPDHFHDADDRQRIPAKGVPIGGGIAGNVGIDPFADLGQDIGIEQRLIHRGIAARVGAPGTPWPRKRSRPSLQPRPAWHPAPDRVSLRQRAHRRQMSSWPLD